METFTQPKRPRGGRGRNPFYHPPFYAWVFRRWLCDEMDPMGTQAEVIVLRSERQLYPDELRERLEGVTHRPAEEYVFVEIEPDSAAVLDTWEPGIESMWPAGAKRQFGARAFTKWWTADAELLHDITPVR